MRYQKFKGDFLFTGKEMLSGDQVLIISEKGEVQEIVPSSDAGDDIQVFEGTLAPGFVNCHCHLELSHLKDVIPPHTGLVDFLISVIQRRGFEKEVIADAITRAEQEMYNNGTVAVGDIGNTIDAIATKQQSNIYWQNFIEVLSFSDARAEENMANYKNILQTFQQALSGKSSLAPHSPYSISPKTFEMINAATKEQIISIHNQESIAEDVLYKTGEGDFLKLYKNFGVEKSPFPITGKSTIQSYLPHFKNGQTIFIVHNTYMQEEDIVFANNYAMQNGLQLVYCFCPNANKYIENQLPQLDLFIKHNCRMVLGTDSYSSNWQLNIAKEIKTLHEAFPDVSLTTLLQMGSLNGAEALQLTDKLGSFEKGKTPGVVAISGDFKSRRIG
ncbi:amidohydrolase family protein [Pinibacter aurantiacus]|uniref:Amidohydrolase family protein n=1 Tax=Pinibacter aurantiacus TaxID=2851599 RepID=A0A9E2S9F5_9BACT|nr:amidohydrolase family protein [Pinibacter aurantiacus]MBV4356375.1 amidohydrolase family protein [Pinibacter aurantiacus]